MCWCLVARAACIASASRHRVFRPMVSPPNAAHHWESRCDTIFQACEVDAHAGDAISTVGIAQSNAWFVRGCSQSCRVVAPCRSAVLCGAQSARALPATQFPRQATVPGLVSPRSTWILRWRTRFQSLVSLFRVLSWLIMLCLEKSTAWCGGARMHMQMDILLAEPMRVWRVPTPTTCLDATKRPPSTTVKDTSRHCSFQPAMVCLNDIGHSRRALDI